MSSSRNLKTYRYISVYLKLIEEIRIEDKEGHKWKYNVNICSVKPTSIEIYIGTTKSFFADKLFLSKLEECSMTFVGKQNILTATIIYQPK
uniref:Uncharacterized protein n=1 Tax=Strongyloides venezuelensis TaxID=75913 RepID=A0A0K0G5K9_STRVS